MRLDHFLLDHGYVQTRSQATDLIKRGLVSVDGIIVSKAGYDVNDDALIKIFHESRFVSRAGDKLNQALIDLKATLHGKIIIDIGSSTGGFTQCALQSGAIKVFAYDVGKNQMDKTLASDPRIELHEETNILDVNIPDADVIVIDVSFTSIKPILSHLKGFQGEIIALIKPQYEAGPIHFKQGVLKDMKQHEKILYDVLSEVRKLGFSMDQLVPSSLKGKMGNQEYFLYIKPKKNIESIDHLIRGVLC